MAFDKDYDYIFKLLIIGDSHVGKSSLLLKYIDNGFNENFNSTIGVDFRLKILDIDDKIIKLQIWDSSGQDRFKSITTLYYRNCHGIIIVFDLTDRKSFENVKIWLNDIKKNCNIENVPKILVGNKSDLSLNRKIPYEEIIEFVNLIDITYIETSAKENKNIDKVFEVLAKDIKNDYKRIDNFSIKTNDNIKLDNKSRSCFTCGARNKCY